jgi:hypothetical protein
MGLGRLAAGADEAQAILAQSGVTGGFIVHVGCGDGQMTNALRVSDAYVVHGLDTDAEANLGVLPVFDGMIAAAGRIYLSTVDGRVVCLGKEAMDFQALERTEAHYATQDTKHRGTENTERLKYQHGRK